MEDPSSIWYDNLEQIKKDYNDMKEVYDIVNAATNDDGEVLPVVVEEETKVNEAGR